MYIICTPNPNAFACCVWIGQVRGELGRPIINTGYALDIYLKLALHFPTALRCLDTRDKSRYQ